VGRVQVTLLQRKPKLQTTTTEEATETSHSPTVADDANEELGFGLFD
jgi:hypothetical protein